MSYYSPSIEKLIENFEKEDKEKGWYTPNFYEIFNDRTKQIVE